MVAKTEDEYVQHAVQLASDINTLSNMRMSLRELMLSSPVCNGAKFAQGLENAYRDLWCRYCRGDVPALRNMDLLLQEQQRVSQELSLRLPDPTPAKAVVGHDIQVKTNGFSVLQADESVISD